MDRSTCFSACPASCPPDARSAAYFNNVGNRYAYSKQHGCLDPPHYSSEKKDFFPPPSFPRPLDGDSTEEDETIPLEWLETAHRTTEDLQAHVEWHQGDVLVIDNLAVQHARTPWTGPRKLVASLWDQPSTSPSTPPSDPSPKPRVNSTSRTCVKMRVDALKRVQMGLKQVYLSERDG